jgi:hypothetical protein
MRYALLTAIVVTLVPSEARAQTLPTPRWASAVCGNGERGDLREVEIRAGGEIRVRQRPTMRDSVIGRDSTHVAELLEKIRHLDWATLRGDTAQSGRWCMLTATWRQERRGLRWYEGPRGRSDLFDFRIIAQELSRMGGEFYDDAPYLEIGCSGGVTGGGGGRVVTSDGRFYSFSTDTYASPREWKLAKRDPARAKALFAAAEQSGLARTDYDVPGNVTCWVSLVSAASGHTVSWALNRAPSKLRRIVALSDEIEK